MNFCDIHPFVRFVRYLSLSEASYFGQTVPLDARLFYAVSGSGTISVSGISYEMKPHSCLIFSQGTHYRLLSPENSVVYLAVNFDYSQNKSDINSPTPPVAADKFRPDMIIDNSSVDDIDIFSKPLYIPEIPILQNMLEKMEFEYSHKLEFYEKFVSNLLCNVLIECTRCRSMKTNLPNCLDADKIINYIHMNHTENISNQKIGEIFGFNPNYVNDVIKKRTGLSLHKYLLRIRIEKAMAYLESRRYTVAETAHLCGFKDIYYFSRYFKKETGMSPLAYMKSV